MKAIPRLEMDRFTGVWHEIARLPHKGRRNDDRQITVTYEPQAEQRLQIIHVWTQANGRLQETTELARRRYPIEDPGEFERLTGPGWLSALRSSWTRYWVLALDPDYRSLMIGEPERQQLWIYSRETTMERATLETLKNKARGLSYDLAPLLISGTLRSFQPL